MSLLETNSTDGFTVDLLQKAKWLQEWSTSQPDGLIKGRASLGGHGDVNKVKSDVEITVRALELKAPCLLLL